MERSLQRSGFSPERLERYRQEVYDRHVSVDFRALSSELDGTPLFAATSPEGLLSLTVLGAQLPERYLHAIFGFRFVQYLQRGWIDESLACAAKLSTEPFDESTRNDFHTLVIDLATGALRGYGTLVAGKGLPMPLASSNRARFVIERDYDLSLADFLGGEVTTGQVWEGKRLIRDFAMPRSAAGATVPWWVYRAWGSACVHVLDERSAVAIVGDAKRQGASFQLGLIGFDVTVIDATNVPPGQDDIYAPMWAQSERSAPFILRDSPRLRTTLDALDEYLTSGRATGIREWLSARLSSTPIPQP